MKQIALMMLLASASWGQTYVTINGPLASADGAGWSGVIVISHPAWTCGVTSVGPERTSVKVAGGVFSRAMLADCPAPYTVDYTGSSSARAFWTIPSTLGSSATIREVQTDFRPAPFFQLSHNMIAIPPGGGVGKCWGSNDAGTVWAWKNCGSGGGGGDGSFIWGLGTGTLANQLDLKTALDGKASLSHAHAISDVVSLQGALNAKIETSLLGAPSGVAGLNSSGFVPTTQLGSGTASSATCLYGDGTYKPCGTSWVAGEGINVIGNTVQVDPALVPLWGSGSTDPTYSATAGRETYLNVASDDWFLRAASGWKKVYTAGRPIASADLPFPGASAKGGILSTLCSSGNASRGYGSDGLPVCVALSSGAGTVTSVGLTLPSDFTVTGSPVTAAGSLAATWASQTGNKFLASPSGSTGAPSFRSIVQLDLGTGSGGAGTKVLYDDLTWKTPAAGGGSGNMTNTGASAISQVPRYTSTLGTDLAPSTMTVDSSGNVVATGTITAGGTGSGCITLPGSTSGSVKICAAAAAGTPADLIPPTSTGTANYILSTDGGTPQQLSWVAKPAAESTSVTNTGTGADVLKTTTNVTARRIKGGTNVTVTQNTDDITIDATGGGGSTGLYSGTIDFGSIPDGGCADGTFTATGLTTGKTLAVGLPSAWNTGLVATAIASAADTAKIRACNFSGAAVDPASATFKVRDMDSLGYLTGTATIDFGSIPDGACLASTITLSGAAAGDSVAAGWPSGLASGLTGSMFVSATDTVAVRLCNWSGAAVDPASGSFKAAITR